MFNGKGGIKTRPYILFLGKSKMKSKQTKPIKQMKKKKDDCILTICVIVFLISTMLGLFLLVTTMNQKQIIIKLAEERFEWCNTFNELKNVTDNLILNYVNRSFEINSDLNCLLLKPIIK